MSGQPPNLSATLTTATGTPLPGQTVTFTVGTGRGAQSCSATTNAAGKASCSICNYNQSASPLPVTVTYGGNTYYSSSSTSQSVTVITPTTLSVSATTATYGQPVTLTGTLTNSVTGQGISGQTITLTLNGTQSCTATTGSNGKGSCSVTPTEPSGTYPVTGSFAGNTGISPQLAGSTGSNKVVVNGAPTTIVYTGATSVTNGQSLTLSATLTSNGTPLSSQPVTLTLGTGKSAQSCTRDDQLVGRGLVHHRVGEPGRWHGDGDRLLRRQQLLRLLEQLLGHQGLQLRRWRQWRWRQWRWQWRLRWWRMRRRLLRATPDRRRPGLRLIQSSGRSDTGMTLTHRAGPHGPALLRDSGLGDHEDDPRHQEDERDLGGAGHGRGVAPDIAPRVAGPTRRGGHRGLQAPLGRPQHPFAHEGHGGEEGEAAQDPPVAQGIGTLAHGEEGEAEDGYAVDRCGPAQLTPGWK